MIKAKYKVGDRIIRAERIFFIDDDSDTDTELIIPASKCIVDEAHIDSVLAVNFGEATYHLTGIEDDEEHRYAPESDITLDKQYYREQSLKDII